LRFEIFDLLMKYFVATSIQLLLILSYVQAQFSNYQVKDNRVYINVNGFYYDKTYEQLNKKQYEAALESATVCVQICPYCPYSHSLLSVVYDEMGDAKKAAKELAIAKKQCNNCAEAYYELASRKAYHGFYNEAIAIMNDGLKKDSISKKASAFYIDRGQIKCWQKDFDGWYADNCKGFNADTNNLGALFNMMAHEVYLHQDSLVFKRLAAIAIDSSKHYFPWYILYKRSGIYLNLKAYDKALDDCNASLALNPQYADTYVTKALAEVFLGKYQEALVDIDTAINKRPKNAWIINNRGFIKIHLQQYQSALQDLESALALDSNVNYAYNNKGYIYFKLGGKDNLQKAIALYDKAIEIGGKYYEPYWKYREEAIAALKQYQ
jgi:tetratricopeptide (TPR) repeat protein